MSTLQGVNVLVSLIDPEMVVHNAHPECPTTEPHRIPECGLFSKEEVVTVDVERLLEAALYDYRCQYTVDEDGNGMPLLDVLSTGETITDGQREFDLLLDHLSAALLPEEKP